MAEIECALRECAWNAGGGCEEFVVVLERPDVIASRGSVDGWVICVSFERRGAGEGKA